MPAGMTREEMKQILQSWSGLQDAVLSALPGGKIESGNYVVEVDGREIAVCLKSTSRWYGGFKDWRSGDSGDVVQLFADYIVRGSLAALDGWIVEHCGAPDSPAQRQAQLRQRQQREEIAEALRLQKGLEKYAAGVADDPGLQNYLAGRGITAEHPPPALRFGRELGWEAMIAPVHHFGAGFPRVGCHLTKLDRDDNGNLRRLKGRKFGKMTFGFVRGGVVPLRQGASQHSWEDVHQVEGHEPLLLGEGIENVESILPAFRGARSCTHMSAGFLASLILPRVFDPVLLVLDRDGENASVRKSREAFLQRVIGEDRRTKLLVPPRDQHDMNDHLRSRVAEGFEPDFSGAPVNLDYRAVLREAVAVNRGDPAACYWEAVTGEIWGEGNEPDTLLLHPALPVLECGGVALPAAVLPLLDDVGRRVGALVAWLARRGGQWRLAPLLLPIRLIGHAPGVAWISQSRPPRRDAAIVLGLEEALIYGAAVAKIRTVLCVLDVSHLVECAPCVPGDVDAVEIYIDDWDASLCGDFMLKVAKSRLAQFGFEAVSVRPGVYGSMAMSSRELRDGCWR